MIPTTPSTHNNAASIYMMLGEVAPGGGGSGLYSLLIFALLAVFLDDLMVGRTSEFLGKRVRRRETTFVALYAPPMLYALTMPAVLLVGTAIAIGSRSGRSSLLNTGAHGMSEALYAGTSAANSNGSAFAGFNANTTFMNTLLAVVMLVGRYLPMVFVLALAGAFARQRTRAEPNGGTVQTHRPAFLGLTTGVAILTSLLSFAAAHWPSDRSRTRCDSTQAVGRAARQIVGLRASSPAGTRGPRASHGCERALGGGL